MRPSNTLFLLFSILVCLGDVFPGNLQAQTSYQGKFRGSRDSVSEPAIIKPTIKPKNRYSPSDPPLRSEVPFSSQNDRPADAANSSHQRTVQVQPDREEQSRFNAPTEYDPEGDQPPSPPSRNSQEPPRFVNEKNDPWLMPNSPTADSFTGIDDRIQGERIANASSNSTTDTDRVGSHQEEADSRRDRELERVSFASQDMDFTPLPANQTPQLTTLDPSQPFGTSSAGQRQRETVEDSNVQRVSFDDFNTPEEQDAQEGSNDRNLEQAQQVVEQYTIDQNEPELPGQPTELLRLLRQPIPHNRRAEMVSQYWSTWSRWAEYQSASKYVQWLQSISASQADAALLNVAKSQANNQLLAARSELSKSQSRLRSFIPIQTHVNGALPPLPLPSDLPLIHKYVTNYQQYKKVRPLPARFQDIDQVLDENLQLIINQAETVNLAKSAAQSSNRNGQGNLGSILEAGRIWRSSEHELIQSVTSYNQAIADYSLNIADSSHPAETVVAMLIKQTPTNAISPANTLNAAANQRLRAQPAKGNAKSQSGFSGDNNQFGNSNNRAQLSSSHSGNQNQGNQGNRNNAGALPQEYHSPAAPNPSLSSNVNAGSSQRNGRTENPFLDSNQASPNRNSLNPKIGSDSQGRGPLPGSANPGVNADNSQPPSDRENNLNISRDKTSGQPNSQAQFNSFGSDPNQPKKEGASFGDLQQQPGNSAGSSSSGSTSGSTGGFQLQNEGAKPKDSPAPSGGLKPLAPTPQAPSQKSSGFSTDFSPNPTEKSTDVPVDEPAQDSQNLTPNVNPSDNKSLPQNPGVNPEDKTADQGFQDFK